MIGTVRRCVAGSGPTGATSGSSTRNADTRERLLLGPLFFLRASYYSSGMADDTPSSRGSDEVHYHLELTPAQLKITHTALKSLLDDFGHEEHEVGKLIHEVLEKLPDEHSIRAIVLDDELQK
jgi:hypothetical protein